MTGDRYDAASRLDRDPATYRVNLGVDRRSYEDLFGPAPRQAAGREIIDTGFDYAATDTLLPHLFYASMHWVCVVNPGVRTRTELAALLVRAHGLAKHHYAKSGAATASRNARRAYSSYRQSMTPSIAGTISACWTPSPDIASRAPDQTRAAARPVGTSIAAAISTFRRAECPRKLIQTTIGTVMLMPISITRNAPGWSERLLPAAPKAEGRQAAEDAHAHEHHENHLEEVQSEGALAAGAAVGDVSCECR